MNLSLSTALYSCFSISILRIANYQRHPHLLLMTYETGITFPYQQLRVMTSPSLDAFYIMLTLLTPFELLTLFSLLTMLAPLTLLTLLKLLVNVNTF